MGKRPGRHSSHPLLNPILPTDLHDLPPQTCGEPQYPDDVYTDSGQFGLGVESCCAVGDGGVEFVGGVCCDGFVAGDVAFYGCVL